MSAIQYLELDVSGTHCMCSRCASCHLIYVASTLAMMHHEIRNRPKTISCAPKSLLRMLEDGAAHPKPVPDVTVQW